MCGQGCTPARATIAEFDARGLDKIPGEGLLAAVVPGAFGAWLATLRDYGTITEGKYADIIAVRGDVLRYIDLLQRVDLVIKHGTRYK